MSSNENERHITNRELNDKLNAIRSEMRLLIVLAVVGGQAAGKVIGTGVASAATSLLGH
jgi:hypothetical protein